MENNSLHFYQLTHWGRDKMAAISQTRFSNAFSWMEMCEFRSRFHWSLFLGIRLTTFKHWFRWWLGTDKATSHYLNRWWLDYRRKYAPLGLTELNGELWNSVNLTEIIFSKAISWVSGDMYIHDDVIKWNYFPPYCAFVRVSTGHRWISLTKVSDMELWCFLWSAPERTAEQTIETPVILDAIALIMTSL